MAQPAKFCDAETFRIVHRLCARLTRKMPYALYLAVLHNAPSSDEALLRRLHNGEVLCRMEDGRLCILLFAQNDEQAADRLSPLLRAFPQTALRYDRVTQRLDSDPAQYD